MIVLDIIIAMIVVAVILLLIISPFFEKIKSALLKITKNIRK